MTAFGGALLDPTKIMGSRIGAYIVDGLIAAVVVFAAFYFFELSLYTKLEASSPLAAERICQDINARRIAEPSADPGDDRMCFRIGSSVYEATRDQLSRGRPATMVVSLGFSLLNLVALPAATGASLGKRLFGLRRVTATGQRAGFFRNLLRWILLIVDGFCCGIVGLLVAQNSAGHRRIGDIAAGTYVVHRSAAGRLLSIPGHLVVRRQHEFGGWGPAPVVEEPGVHQGGGVNAPAWDPARNAYVRYDAASGVWFQWDEGQEAWVPAQT